MFNFLRHFRSFSRKHGSVSLEGLSNSNLYEIRRRVSTSFPTNLHAFSISFRTVYQKSSFLLLIQISSPRRNNKVLTSVIYKSLCLLSRYSSIRVLSWLSSCYMTWLAITAEWYTCPTHQARTHFYITPLRQKNLASRENYASELYQVMIMRLLKVARTSC